MTAGVAGAGVADGAAGVATGVAGVAEGGEVVRRLDPILESFAGLVGPSGPVCVVGGRTQWAVGGFPAPGTREVAAPAGVVSHQPEEMIVRVRAGTTVATLNSVLAAAGQMVPFDPVDPDGATVGGVLSVGHSGLRRLRYGPVRDTVLEARFVSAAGEMVKAGGPVVKNVTGYDLCRLLVGSLGTLGLLAEVVLRCSPLPAAQRWLSSVDADPFQLVQVLHRPSSVLWDGSQVWVLVEGHPDDVAAQAKLLGPAYAEVAGPPESAALWGGHRLSLPAAKLRDLAALAGSGSRWLAQVGVGLVHCDDAASVAASLGVTWPPVLGPGVAELHRQLRNRFDPARRLNPGRQIGAA